jgi:hypothetical protein
MNEWNNICDWIRKQDDCPDDAQFLLCTPDDGRIWIDVFSDELAFANYEVDTNTGDPGWHTFEVITTDKRHNLEAENADLLAALKWVSSWINPHHCDDCHKTVDKLKQAIARAEGGE